MLFHRKAQKRKQSIDLSMCNVNPANWRDVFSACLGKMMAIQHAFAQLVVKNQDWNVDFTKGEIAFGTNVYPIQFLGSEANNDGSWLWGWENINGFSEEILKLAQETKQLGETMNLDALMVPEFAYDDHFNAHTLGIVACGLAQDFAYYRGPHAGGAILVAVSNLPEEVFAPIDAMAFVHIITQCIQQYPCDQRILCEAFLQWNETASTWDGLTLFAHFDQEMRITFEEVEGYLRIISMKTV